MNNSLVQYTGFKPSPLLHLSNCTEFSLLTSLLHEVRYLWQHLASTTLLIGCLIELYRKSIYTDIRIPLVGIEPEPSDYMLDLKSQGPGSIPTRGIIVSQDFFSFSHSKDENATIGISVRM